MNLEESNSYNQEVESRDRKRRGVMLSIILCGVFIALLFIMICIISYKDSITEKFFINRAQTVKLNNSLYRDIEGVIYIDIRTLAENLGYRYTKGEYKKYNENEDSCYLQNDFEIVAITSGKCNYDKYIELAANATIAEIPVTAKGDTDTSETYKTETPIMFVDGRIFVPLDAIPKMLNVKISWEQYRKRIYTLDYVVQNAQAVVVKAGYTEMSGYYENLRATLDDIVIVGDAEAATTNIGNTSKYYGVYSTAKKQEIISRKYDDITYIQNVGEFYITVENGTMGLFDAEGGTIIEPSEYEKISLLYESTGENDEGEKQEQQQFYLVQKGQDYGVVGRKGQVIIHSDYDKIGLDPKIVDEFSLTPIESTNVLFDNCIPVEKDGNVGLYNKQGDELQKTNWQGFGYKSTASSKTAGNEQSVLLIPPEVGIKGIVVNFNDSYGIFDAVEERLIVPCVYSKIYAITQGGKTTYYMEYNEQTIELKEFLIENNLNKFDEEGKLLTKKDTKNNSSNGNTETSENTNTVNEENENTNTVEDVVIE